MKAIIKKTGEMVNIAEHVTIELEMCDSYGDPVCLVPEDVELIQEQSVDEHWQEVRERASIAAMQGVIGLFSSLEYNKETIAELAVAQADALVEGLKENNYEQD